jgi:thiamine kinase-like enzyme
MRKSFSISNEDGKTWTLPFENTGVAFEIYQPSGYKGKILKGLLPLFVNFKIVPIKHTVVDLDDMIPEEVIKRLQIVFGDDIELSLFSGTPGTHKKPTVQIYKGKNLLGYAKYSNSQDIKDLFMNEYSILNELAEKEIRSIPKGLACENMESGMLFIQDTKKKVNAKTLHKYGSKHEAFLKAVHNRTKVILRFEDTDFCKMLMELDSLCKTLSADDARLVHKYINECKNYYRNDENTEYSFCHRDFTPWNTCMVDKDLFVFDWEYAKRTYPYGMDRARFIVDVLRREKHYSPIQIITKIKVDKQILIDYILDNLYLYLLRGQESDYNNIYFSLSLLRELEVRQ